MHSITKTLVKHYEHCLRQHGPTPAGMDWGNDPGRLRQRFDVICRAIDLEPTSVARILDAGCGAGLLLDYLNERTFSYSYVGIDASQDMISVARVRHPQHVFQIADVATSTELPHCDWVVANGIFTEKREHSDLAMIAYTKAALQNLFEVADHGLVFNVMSTYVNYQDPFLFYWDPAEVLTFLLGRFTRHVSVYHDLNTYDVFYCVRRSPWEQQ